MIRHERYVGNRMARLLENRDTALHDVVEAFTGNGADIDLFDAASAAFDASTPALQGLERFRSRRDSHLSGDVVDDAEHSLTLFTELEILKQER